MKAKTRVEVISGYVYCAYCGKLLVRHDYPVTIPEQVILCNCDKANEELELYDKIKELYNTPLAENVVDLKVEAYKKKLLGIEEPMIPYGYSIIAGSAPFIISPESIDNCISLTGVSPSIEGGTIPCQQK